jgi:hypothetical protein
MVFRSRSPVRGAAVAVLLVLAAPIAMLHAPLTAQATAQQAAAQTLPVRLSDADFWKLTADISEPGGYFQIEDNFTSNEAEVGQLFSMLRANKTAGGVYMGVGPEQNFSYIAAIRPAMAFVVDIRRQAVMQHLMFKAIFELSKDRADFLSLLFSKPRPAGIDSMTPIQKIWDLYWPVATDLTAGPKNYARILDHLTKTHGFTFTADELTQIKWVWDAFYTNGPIISTRGAPGGRGGGNGTTFADLTGYSVDASGQPQSFLSSEQNYRVVKLLHEKNLIVAVSGDFGGPRAIRKIGAYVAEHGGTVSAFYVSNVEQYLFQDGKQGAFYGNVGTLPVTQSSIFIRPYSMRNGRGGGGGGATLSMCPIASYLRAFNAGRVYGYTDSLACPS